MSAAALLESIVHTRVRLSAVSHVRIALSRKPGAAGMQTRAALGEFVKRRLPILKFHNDNLKVDIRRPAGAGAGSIGIDVLRGNEWYILPHARVTDDVLFEQIVALDRGEMPEGVVAGEIVKDAPAAEAKA